MLGVLRLAESRVMTLMRGGGHRLLLLQHTCQRSSVGVDSFGFRLKQEERVASRWIGSQKATLATESNYE
jgi:hypothetical protein